MQTITIEPARNGYIVRETPREAFITGGPPLVFESFESLSRWLKENLTKPAESAVAIKQP